MQHLKLVSVTVGGNTRPELGPGDYFGEISMIDGQPRSATGTAVGLCAAYFLPAEPFLDALEGSTLVCMKLLAHVTERLRRANGRLSELGASISLSNEHDVPDRFPENA